MSFLRKTMIVCSLVIVPLFSLKLALYSDTFAKPVVTFLIQQLAAEKYRDAAFLSIYFIGQPAIPHLIENASTTTAYRIFVPPDPSSSLSASVTTPLYLKVNTGIVSMYLIDAIVKNTIKPALPPLILWDGHNDCSFSDLGNTCEETQQEAVKHYQKWWIRVKNKDIKLNKENLALTHTDLYWSQL